MAKRAGFVGLRLPAVVFGVCCLGTVCALVAWQIVQPEQERALSSAQDALLSRAEAAEGALSALDEVQRVTAAAQENVQLMQVEAKERRASELALLAAMGPVPEPFAPQGGEGLGLVWPGQDRLSGLGHTGTATLSVQYSRLAAALAAAPEAAQGLWVIREAEGVYALGPAPKDRASPRSIAFVPLAAPAPEPAQDVLRSARAALGNVATPASAPLWVERPEWVLGLAALLGALIAALWARGRVSAPLLDTLDAARDFIHGDPGARADDSRGGREAREVARAVNGLVERAVRLENQGRAAKEEDIQAAAVAIEALGKGDLAALTPRLEPPFGPVSRALDRARRDLMARVEQLHDVSRGVAMAACEVAPGARKLESVTDSQRQALERMAQGLAEAEQQIRSGQENLRNALQGLSMSAADQRRTTGEIKTTLSTINRRVADLSTSCERIASTSKNSKVIEQGLSLLGTWAASGGPDPSEYARATQLVGEGKAAFTHIAIELHEVKDDLQSAAETLGSLAAEHIEAPPDPVRTASQPLFEAASGLIRAGELTQQGLGAWVRTVRQLAQETATVADGADSASARLSELSEALSDLRVGDAFETALLERLERARKEADKEGLTQDGAMMLAEVEAAAEAARARVGKLIQATEATLDVLRG